MQLIKVGAANLNQTPFDWDNNTANIKAAIAQARTQGVSILCLPELCITGYNCEDDFYRTDLRHRAWEILKELLPETKNMIVTLGLPVPYNNALFNCAALIVDGQLLGLVPKQNLAGDGIHYEPRWFDAWDEGVVSRLHIDGASIPMGDIHFDVGGVKIGFEICEDAWVGKRPGGKLASKGVDIFLNPSASHFAIGKIATRTRLVLEGSRAFGASYIYANLVGNEAGRAIYDGGTIIASGGKLLACGPRFSFSKVEVTSATIDVDHTRMTQSRTFSYKPELDNCDADCIRADFSFPTLTPPAPTACEPAEWEIGKNAENEELARSVALGLFDYMRKTRSYGYTVSLSGGADSSAVCCFVSLMVELGIQSLGMDAFKQRLSYVPGLKDKDSPHSIMSLLLNCAYQGSANSSENTKQSARQFAQALGATFLEFDITKLVDGYTSMVSKAIGRDLTWEKDDITLQNIQARVRSPGIWMLANIKNTVLLCTSNRSEGAVGYCTMDGDTSGGLAPIAGVDKKFIRQWLRWMEKHGPAGLHSYPELSVVNQQTPGPELRPQGAAQTGEHDLMPYEVLDAIEEAAIENNESVSDCYQLMRARFPQHGAKQMAQWIEKFFHLWSRNQWKRERMAPALHVASRNLDPRTWRRSPIISGGFKKELEEMWRLANADESNAGKGAGQKTHRALLLIDVQKGFGSRGELPVPDAESIVPVINGLIPEFELVVASQDWHPANHVSFAKRHGKQPGESHNIGDFEQPLFTVHCVENTPGADFIEGLNTNSFKRVFRKGTDSEIDSFSVFNDNVGGKATDIEKYLKDQGVKDVYIAGLATNYCVYCSAMDAAKAGFNVNIIIDACRGIDVPQGAVEDSLKRLKAAGVRILSSKDVLSAKR